MSRLQNVKIELQKLYEYYNVEVVLEVMDIIDKYSDVTSKELLNFTADELQADSLRLTVLNFYLSSLSGNLDADAVQACNQRKYHLANNWANLRENQIKSKQGEIDMLAEKSIGVYRKAEGEAQRKSKIVSSAVSSIIEIVNMLKKIVERIMVEGQRSGCI